VISAAASVFNAPLGHPAQRRGGSIAAQDTTGEARGTIRAMELGYARQELHMAVEGFVVATDSLPHRLYWGYTNHLIKLREENFTPELWVRFERLNKAVTMYPAKGDEGVVKATTSQMTDREAALWIKEILSLFNVVVELDVISRSRTS
jgi:hypothetical protein